MRCFLLLILSFGLIGVVTQVQAQETGPNILSDEALVDFPHTVTFRLELDPEAPIVDAVLTYQLGRDSCLTAGTHVPVETNDSTLEWTWVLSRSGNPPPGAQLWWEWTITDATGNTFTTPRQAMTFVDDRFDWRTVEAEGSGGLSHIRLHWYRGDDVGPLLLDAAVAGLERLEQDTGIVLEGDIQIFIYGDTEDMRQALLYTQEWVGGVAFIDYGVVLIGVPPNQADTWGVTTVRHELAHLVTDQFAQSCVGGSRPTWLNEGLSVYAEGEPSADVLSDIESGINEDAFHPVRSLNGAFPARGTEASMAYSQSYSLVAYLLDTYGQERMQQFLSTLAEAVGYDAALEQVYGFNADGLETAWRTSIGAPQRQIPPTPTPISAANVPTVVPLNAAQSVPTPEAGAPTGRPVGPDSGSDVATPSSPEEQSNPAGICGLGLVPIMFFGIVIGWRNRRNRR